MRPLQKFGVAASYLRAASSSSTGAAAFVQRHTKPDLSLPSHNPTARSLSKVSHSKLSDSRGSACEVSNNDTVRVPDLVAARGSAATLRAALLKDASGDTVRLGDRMGPNTSIVVFLRHLA
mmetsp:Transcript_35163/g.84862  ORF Transcript_35163/g.84862 Transcript_35163/m.84862 type:complete len:121 (-) Transcript_35163:701-1063(-)